MSDKMEEWEEVCPECNGEKFIKGEDSFSRVCRKCLGEGKISWIDNVIKRKHDVNGTLKFIEDYIHDAYKSCMDKYKQVLNEFNNPNEETLKKICGEGIDEILRKDK